MFNTSIPAIKLNQNGDITPIHPIAERLVPLNGVREDCLVVSPLAMNETVYVRDMVMNLLVLAASKLPKGVKLEVKKGWQDETPFHTGGVVEVRLIADDGSRIPMGDELPLRAYDDKEAVLTDEERTFLNNRRLLYHCMHSVGFVAKSNVWWHYEFGTRYWGAVTEKSAFYDCTQPLEKN